MRASVVIAAIIGLAAASPVVVERQALPDPDEVYVERVTWAGSGCPPGSVSADLGESGTLVSLSFSNYVARTGGTPETSNARRNCNVRITLHYPQGWSWTVATTDHRGYANIPAGCSARLGAEYFFSGQQDDASVTVPFNGPIDDNYLLTTAVAHDALVWSRCGVTGPLFNINSQAIVNCGQSAELGVDTQDTKFEMLLHLSWERCDD